jgi:hypothetical protein
MARVLPVSRSLRLRSILLWTFIAVSLSGTAVGQITKVDDPGPGSVPLTAKWRFHLGDDLKWADPSLDDSGWELIRPDATWGEQTHPGYTGFAWYRVQIEVDHTQTAPVEQLAVMIPPVEDAYEIYWNGQKLGSYGQLPPNANWWQRGHAVVYPLPSASGVLALRVWKSVLSSVDQFEEGGLESAPQLGSEAVLAAKARAAFYQQDERRLPNLLISAVTLVAGLLSFLLFIRDRKQGLYLWLSVYLIASGLHGSLQIAAFYFGATFRLSQLSTQLLISMTDISIWWILLALFGMAQQPRWKRVTKWVVAIYLAAQAVDIIAIFLWDRGGMLPWIDGVSTAVYSITPLYVFVIVAVGLGRRNRAFLWPLITAVCANGLYAVVLNLAGQGRRFTHWTLTDRLAGISVTAGIYHFNLGFLLGTLLFLALIFTVAREQFRARDRQAQIELEVKSAREVQQILVPEETPAIPGLSIASVYRPAEEVGGDFFQVVELPNGSALIALGDVSGKGLKAAMTVSLIVGTLRTLAEFTESPSAILDGLNRRLLGRVDGGFVTCLVARIDPDGDTTIANAGHLPPYRDGQELPVKGSLPLGLRADAAYDELALNLHEHETLTFYTDGILEARNKAGELFGFDRVTALVGSNRTIEEMVQEARNFGQQDDITIFRITRLSQSAPAEAAQLKLATQISGVSAD